MDEKNVSKFLTGSWNTFKLQLNEVTIYTPAMISKKIEEEFSKLFKVIIEVFMFEDLICFFLLLNERKKKKHVGQDKHFTKFRVAISIEDSLFFCNRSIPGKYRKIFENGLNVDEMRPYDLAGSHPSQLLLLYRQARSNYLLFIDQQQQRSQAEVPFSKILDKIGTTAMPIPQIKKLSFDIINAPLGNNEKKGIRLSEVNISMSGKSIFEHYDNMVKSGVIDTLPLWLKASRAKGKTHRRLHYN